MKRAVYDKPFKLAAVKLAGTGASSAVVASKEPGIRTSSLRRWINEYDEYGESAFPGHGNALFNSACEIKSCKREMQRCGRRTVNAKRVSRLMSEHGLAAKGTNKKYRRHPDKNRYEEQGNILEQVFKAERKNLIWVGDITYIHDCSR